MSDNSGPIIGNVVNPSSNDLEMSAGTDVKTVTFDLTAPSVSDNYNTVSDDPTTLKLKWKILAATGGLPAFASGSQYRCGNWNHEGSFAYSRNQYNGWLSSSGVMNNVKLHFIDSPLKIQWYAQDEAGKLPEVGLSLGKRIQQARMAKSLTQKQLATLINEKPNVVAEYEQGKAIPNNQILGKLERKLGVKLRGLKKK